MLNGLCITWNYLFQFYNSRHSVLPFGSYCANLSTLQMTVCVQFKDFILRLSIGNHLFWSQKHQHI